MKKVYLINFSLMEKIADKKNGVTTEDAAAFVISVEIFFACLVVEFFVMKMLPFKISNVVMFGVMAVIWGYTHYILRKSLGKVIIEAGIRKMYNQLGKPKQRFYAILSVMIFFIVFILFFAGSVWAIGGYDKRWQ